MFFERPESGERAILVHMEMAAEADQESPRELEELALSAGADPIEMLTGSRSKPSPKYYIGSGKLDELKQLVHKHEATLVIFNHAMSPAQERNVETELECRVLDRTGLILDIFAQRARTHEGKLQVELAQLEHMSTRLVRGWTHLDREKGGIGLRGPGEKQLETDRRLLRERVKTIHKRLQKVRTQREQGRKARARAEIPTLALVGYTNAGKSSIFNKITRAHVYAADQLFATLDPTLRKIDLADVGAAILVDTVGFIRHLPHKLVESFRATLQETAEATLLLHVIDSQDEERAKNMLEVDAVLAEIGASDVPILQLYNKIDMLDGQRSRIDYDSEGKPVRVWLSAVSGEGLDLMSQAITQLLCEDLIVDVIKVAPQYGQLRSLLFEKGAVVSESIAENGDMLISVRVQRKYLLQMLTRVGMPTEPYRIVEVY
ncbi:MAG: HSR1-like GTP-binding protein [Osedax symbiont Rs1]|nr:MAG: HSR1-like GTP-binding protein [Osedax symbiont Rs1]